MRRRNEQEQKPKSNQKMSSGIPYYYGVGKSFEIWTGSPRMLVDPASIVVADLTDWTYRPLPGQVAVDPQLGRIAFPPTQTRRQGVWVTYNYAFSADIGGGEYQRTLSQPAVTTFIWWARAKTSRASMMHSRAGRSTSPRTPLSRSPTAERMSNRSASH